MLGEFYIPHDWMVAFSFCHHYPESNLSKAFSWFCLAIIERVLEVDNKKGIEYEFEFENRGYNYKYKYITFSKKEFEKAGGASIDTEKNLEKIWNYFFLLSNIDQSNVALQQINHIFSYFAIINFDVTLPNVFSMTQYFSEIMNFENSRKWGVLTVTNSTYFNYWYIASANKTDLLPGFFDPDKFVNKHTELSYDVQFVMSRYAYGFGHFKAFLKSFERILEEERLKLNVNSQSNNDNVNSSCFLEEFEINFFLVIFNLFYIIILILIFFFCIKNTYLIIMCFKNLINIKKNLIFKINSSFTIINLLLFIVSLTFKFYAVSKDIFFKFNVNFFTVKNKCFSYINFFLFNIYWYYVLKNKD